MQSQVNPKFEIAMSVGLILFSILVFYFSLELPEPEYEPLGSAALPQGLSVIMSLLSFVVILRAIPRLKTYDVKVDPNPEVIPRPLLSIAIFILTLIFIGVLDFGILGFLPAGIIYLSVIGYLMTNREMKRLPWVIGFSIILTVSSFYIFTKLFYIDLP